MSPVAAKHNAVASLLRMKRRLELRSRICMPRHRHPFVRDKILLRKADEPSLYAPFDAHFQDLIFLDCFFVLSARGAARLVCVGVLWSSFSFLLPNASVVPQCCAVCCLLVVCSSFTFSLLIVMWVSHHHCVMILKY